jgi:hypothetical protein
MRKMKKWIINKRIYNIKRNANLVVFGALLDIDTFNRIQKIRTIKGIKTNEDFVRECYKIAKRSVNI